MFERYTEKARRVIFFARYEASQFGSPYIEIEHLLLGLLREDKALTNRFLRSHRSVESIRKQIEEHTTIREKVSTSVDIPLSNECKRALAYAAEEAERLLHKHIGTEHLLLGLLREEKSFAAEILLERGLKLDPIREALARASHDTSAWGRRINDSALLRECSRELTQAALDHQLEPLAGRREELDGVIEILCSRKNRNPVLLGEHGAGKTPIVAGLAQLIANENVPSFLADKRILIFQFERLAGWKSDRPKFSEQLNNVIRELELLSDVILFIDDLPSLISGGLNAPEAVEVLKPALMGERLQFVATSTPTDYDMLTQTMSWIARCFRPVKVLPLNDEQTINLLSSRKQQYEIFHGVTYTEEALQYAVRYSTRYFRDDPKIDKALDILDAAGSRVKAHRVLPPEEVIEVQKRISLIVQRMEDSIANHEFEKARSYFSEGDKERENLRALRDRLGLDDSALGVVGRKDIEEVVCRWTGTPITSLSSSEELEPLVAGAEPDLPKNVPMLRAFICHSSDDKPAIRDLYQKLQDHGIDPWLDEENLLPGQDWDIEITNAVRSAHVVIVCLSTRSINKAGYLQKEIRKVLDVADEQAENTIFLIPLKLEECEVPSRLRRWHWVNLFEPKGFERLMRALTERGRTLAMGAPRGS